MKLPSNIDSAEAWAGDDRLPPGIYLAKIAEAKEETSSKGNPMLVLTWRVEQGEWRGSEIREWVTVIESTAGKVVALLQYTGTPVPPDGMLDPSALVGKRAEIVVRPDTYVKDGEVKPTTKIKGYREPGTSADTPADAATFTHAPAGRADDDVPF